MHNDINDRVTYQIDIINIPWFICFWWIFVQKRAILHTQKKCPSNKLGYRCCCCYRWLSDQSIVWLILLPFLFERTIYTTQIHTHTHTTRDREYKEKEYIDGILTYLILFRSTNNSNIEKNSTYQKNQIHKIRVRFRLYIVQLSAFTNLKKQQRINKLFFFWFGETISRCLRSHGMCLHRYYSALFADIFSFLYDSLYFLCFFYRENCKCTSVCVCVCVVSMWFFLCCCGCTEHLFDFQIDSWK